MIERVFVDYREAVAYRQELKLLGFKTKLTLLENGSVLIEGKRYG